MLYTLYAFKNKSQWISDGRRFKIKKIPEHISERGLIFLLLKKRPVYLTSVIFLVAVKLPAIIL
ncbi:hypothetical protein BMS3Abin03_00536 [bacterium BMS3Abin03]|nr:hypothetical protein BMS3Abin03_00536 [bacterium BMS3Abin03]